MWGWEETCSTLENVNTNIHNYLITDSSEKQKIVLVN